MQQSEMKAEQRFVTLSKTVSHALRHEPWLYELELDEEGWVLVESLLSAVRAEKPELADTCEADLVEMIERSDKKRHEIHGGKIRAMYGHSVPGKLLKVAAEPPEVLYHGTAPEVVEKIKAQGLKPMGRQYVHLSADAETAEQVGKRKASRPVILKVDAAAASAVGVRFYRGNDRVWLADNVPSLFISESSQAS